jgi:dGTP triphosphohydrolase
MRAARKKHRRIRQVLAIGVVAAAAVFSGCKTSGSSGTLDILGPSDETAEAAKLVAEANEDLSKIKVLYKNNENKREELKKAMEANEAEKVKKIADDVVYLINDGFDSGKSAVDKIEKAQEMQLNDDYREYLRLKEESLKRQMEAFENYRQAARSLRDNYDPKNAQQREKVKEEFKTRSENYAKIMEEARDFSNRANELAKEALRKQQD